CVADVGHAMNNLIRVLLVDDSVYLRQVLPRHLQVDPGIIVVGRAKDGADALGQLDTLKPDVIVMDVEMPNMDGLTALKHILAERPTPVVMFSAYAQRGAQTTVQALMQGAVDFVPKPDPGRGIDTVADELRAKIRVAARTSAAAHSTV